MVAAEAPPSSAIERARSSSSGVSPAISALDRQDELTLLLGYRFARAPRFQAWPRVRLPPGAAHTSMMWLGTAQRTSSVTECSSNLLKMFRGPAFEAHH